MMIPEFYRGVCERFLHREFMADPVVNDQWEMAYRNPNKPTTRLGWPAAAGRRRPPPAAAGVVLMVPGGSE